MFKWLFGNRHSVFDIILIVMFTQLFEKTPFVAMIILVVGALLSALMQQYVNVKK